MEPPIANPFKLGRHEPGLGVIEHRFDNVFELDGCGMPPSLAIASHTDQIGLLLRIANLAPGPFRLVYALLVPFGGYAEGRYELTQRFDYFSLGLLLSRYRQFFERDARHHLVIDALDNDLEVSYDQHNFICLKGPVDQVRGLLEEEGYVQGSVALPIPHSHHHHPEFDAMGAQFLAENSWTRTPLLETD